ncbi:MAG: hypothetical protein IKX00_02380 [Bacilli bacterium]|nr:hypothetical protein [Bacilli bacterium]
MASLLIHLAVGKKVNEKLCKKEEPFLTGCIAPDLAKFVGLKRSDSHFQDHDGNYDLKKFLDKYYDYINNEYVLGYYVHLYTDYLWYRYFASEIMDDNYITKLDGTKVKYVSENMAKLYLYNDYSNMSFDLINEYGLDLEFFHKNEYYSNSIIEEVPYDQINILIDATVDILNQKTYKSNFVFNFEQVKQFIDIIADYIIANLKEEKLI